MGSSSAVEQLAVNQLVPRSNRGYPANLGKKMKKETLQTSAANIEDTLVEAHKICTRNGATPDLISMHENPDLERDLSELTDEIQKLLPSLKMKIPQTEIGRQAMLTELLRITEKMKSFRAKYKI